VTTRQVLLEGDHIPASNIDGLTWQDWTPVVDQGGAVAITVNEAKYCLIGKVCHLYAHLIVTGSGTAGNAIAITGAPFAPVLGTPWLAVGSGVVADISHGVRAGSLTWDMSAFYLYQDLSGGGAMGYAPDFALAAPDVISFTATYRVV
jgi:hypothetical protein